MLIIVSAANSSETASAPSRSLHPALIEEGFPQIPRRLPKTGPLFPHRAIHGVTGSRANGRDAWLPDEVKNALLGRDDALPAPGRLACPTSSL